MRTLTEYSWEDFASHALAMVMVMAPYRALMPYPAALGIAGGFLRWRERSAVAREGERGANSWKSFMMYKAAPARVRALR